MGNSRVSYTEGANGNAQVVEENSYYAFGLQHKGYGPAPTGLGNAHAEKYRYQGQERQEEFGLGWDSFKWRNYDYAIGRFFNVDPLAEKYQYNSVYAFQENKLGLGRELEGLEMVADRSKDGKSATIIYHVKPVNASRLSAEDFKTVVDARASLINKQFSGKTADGGMLTFKVQLDSNATVSWEYNEMINIDGKQVGNAMGFTLKKGDTQKNRTQVNVYSELGVDESTGELKSLKTENVKSLAVTGGEEDAHVGGVPDIGDNKMPQLEHKMLNDPKKNMLHHNSNGENILPEQRSLILTNALKQSN